MKIVSLKLQNYNRIKLKHIQNFEYYPSEKIQIILGTNGSGKSSVLHELSPLPAESKNYGPDGNKTIVIEHLGSVYTLVSSFAKGQHHSFIKDDQELNQGGTYTVQKDLVKQYFSITPDIQEMMLGLNPFTNMSPAERRSWFTRLSDANYDYAIQVYNRVKERHRDVSGAIKTLKKDLVVQDNKVLSAAELKQLEDECNAWHTLLSFLLEHRMPVQQDQEILQRQQDKKLSSIEFKTQSLSKLITKVKSYQDDLSTMDDDIAKIQADIRSFDHLSDHYFIEHKRLSEALSIAEKVNDQSVVNIASDIKVLEDKRQEILRNRPIKVNLLTEPVYGQELLRNTEQWILPLVPTLIDFQNRGFTVETYQLKLKDKEALDNEIQSLKTRIQKNIAVRNHYASLKNNTPIECPNCKHMWINHFDEQKYSAVQESISLDEQSVSQMLKTQEQLLAEIKDTEDYLNVFSQLDKIIERTSVFSDFWDYFLANDYPRKNPSQIPRVLDQYAATLFDEVLAQEKLAEIKNKNHLKILATENKDLNTEQLKKQTQELQEKIASLQDKHRKQVQRLRYYKDIENDLQSLDKIEIELTKELSESEDMHAESIELLRRQTFNDLVRDTQSKMSVREKLLHEAKSHEMIVARLKAQLTSLENQEEVLKAVMKELSPTEGIIAEGLFGFMRLFVNQLNAIIKRIWTYPLVVQPCQLDSSGAVELNYKFPVIVDTQDHVRDDISKGSTAMKEVIDLAFMITAMKALHLGEYPLYLDEFGSTMDPTHKAATINLINMIMEQDNFTQLFMISHDSIQYGALSNTQVCVLASENMLLSKDSIYNQHVVIS